MERKERGTTKNGETKAERTRDPERDSRATKRAREEEVMREGAR